MYKVLVIMCIGFLSGVCTRKLKLSLLPRIISILILVLLFVLGLETGANSQVMENLDSLGLYALIMAITVILGSAAASWILWKLTKENSNEK